MASQTVENYLKAIYQAERELAADAIVPMGRLRRPRRRARHGDDHGEGAGERGWRATSRTAACA